MNLGTALTMAAARENDAEYFRQSLESLFALAASSPRHRLFPTSRKNASANSSELLQRQGLNSITVGRGAARSRRYSTAMFFTEDLPLPQEPYRAIVRLELPVQPAIAPASSLEKSAR